MLIQIFTSLKPAGEQFRNNSPSEEKLKNIYMTYSTDSSPFGFSKWNILSFKTSLILGSSFDEGHLISTRQFSRLSTFVTLESSDIPRKGVTLIK